MNKNQIVYAGDTAPDDGAACSYSLKGYGVGRFLSGRGTAVVSTSKTVIMPSLARGGMWQWLIQSLGLSSAIRRCALADGCAGADLWSPILPVVITVTDSTPPPVARRVESLPHSVACALAG